MKYIGPSLIFALLFIVPAGSWYYLQSGHNYRKQALEELKPKVEFFVDGYAAPVLKSKTTLFQLLSTDKDVLTKVFDQYKKSNSYQVIALEKPKNAQRQWITLSPTDAQLIATKYDSAAYILVDTNAVVRNTFSADKEGIRKMIEHTAIILPRVKERDIKLRRNVK